MPTTTPRLPGTTVSASTQPPTLMRAGKVASLGSGWLAVTALIIVFANEATRGQDWVATGWASLAGWASFIGACLLVVGLIGLAVRFSDDLSSAGMWALAGLGFTGAVTAGAMSTLALVVPDLAHRMPDITTNPPAAVPPTFILSGLAMGVCGLVLAVALRRVATVSRWAGVLLIAGSIATMLPLPSRYFLLAFGVAAVLGSRAEE
jgi:hypothetical protein